MWPDLLTDEVEGGGCCGGRDGEREVGYGEGEADSEAERRCRGWGLRCHGEEYLKG